MFGRATIRLGIGPHSSFGFKLWRPRKQRAQHHKGVSSRNVLPNTDTADHVQSREYTAASTVGNRNAVSEVVFGCLNIRSVR